MSRLGARALPALPADIAGPAYDPSQVRIGVLHFGPGAFHRAHQGAYFDRALAKDLRWGVSAVSLRSGGTIDALRRQDGLYSLSILDRHPSIAILAPHREWIGPGEDDRLRARFVDPDLRLVTATVTEKGYCLSGDGTLDIGHAEVAHDLSHPQTPRSFPGWLVAGLAARRSRGLPAPVIMSCDNLGQNGRKLKGAVLALAGARDADLARYIDGEVAFPNTMVDSITPASDAPFLGQVQARLGAEDRAAVKREAFSQWIIERIDDPIVSDLGSVGAALSSDVAGWESAKLRILNGAHSSLAYLGLLRGHCTVADAMHDEALADFVQRMIRQEVWPGLGSTDGLDLGSYTDAVLDRFRNPALDHLLSQIAWDGSQKLPYRLLASLAAAMDSGRPFARLAFAVAGWMAFCAVKACGGEEIIDPLGRHLTTAALAAAEQRSADPMLALGTIFPPDLVAHPLVRSTLNADFRSLMEKPRRLPP